MSHDLDDDKISSLVRKFWNYGLDGKHGTEEFLDNLNDEGYFEGVVQ